MFLRNFFIKLTLINYLIKVNFVAATDQYLAKNKIYNIIEKTSSRAPAKIAIVLQNDKNFMTKETKFEGSKLLLENNESPKIETTSPADWESPNILRVSNDKKLYDKIPEILGNEKLKKKEENIEKEDFLERDHSRALNASLRRIMNFINLSRDENQPTTSVNGNDENGSSNKTKHTKRNAEDPLFHSPEVINKTDFASAQRRTHSINIESFIDRMLSQIEKERVHRIPFQVSQVIGNKEIGVDNTSTFQFKAEAANSSLNNSFQEEKEVSREVNSKEGDPFHSLETSEDNLSSNKLQGDHSNAFENIVNKLVDIISQYKGSNATDSIKHVTNFSSITNELIDQLNYVMQSDKSVVDNDHLSQLAPVLKRPINKKINITSQLDDQLKNMKDARTELVLGTNLEADSDEDENVEKTIFAYILDKLRDKLSKRSSITLKSKENRSAETVTNNKIGKTTIFIYPQSKVETNQTEGKLKLDLFTNTNNKLPPFYTILNGQVIGSINLDSILKSNSYEGSTLKSRQMTKDEVVPVATVIKEPFVRIEENPSLNETSKSQQFSAPDNVSNEMRHENVSNFSKSDKIMKINDFITFLKTIQEKLDSDKPKLELKSGFDLSSLKVISSSNRGDNAELKLAQQMNIFKNKGYSASPGYSEGNFHSKITPVSRSSEESKLYGSSSEDTYEDYVYSTEDEEFYNDRSAIPVKNEMMFTGHSNIDVISNNSNKSRNDDRSHGQEMKDSFEKRSEDFGKLFESMSGRMSVPPSGMSQNVGSIGKSQRKTKRRKTKVKFQQNEDFSTINCQCGRTSNYRIVGGEDTSISRHPWVVQLVMREGSPFCGGTLINNMFILTAAHCLKDRKAEDVIIRMGSTMSNQGSSFPVRRLIPHEEYSPSMVTLYDIALVELEEPIFKYTSSIKPICLPNIDTRSPDMKKGLIAGFGSLSENGPQSDALQEAKVLVMESTTCGENYKYSQDQLNPLILCAKGEHVDSCQGDSGGPLIRKIGNYHVQLGVTSWGIGCAREDYPGIYTKVAPYMSWIESITYEAAYCQKSVTNNRHVIKSPSINSSAAEEDYKIMSEFIQNIARQLRRKDKFVNNDQIRIADTYSAFEPDSLKNLNKEDTFELIHG